MIVDGAAVLKLQGQTIIEWADGHEMEFDEGRRCNLEMIHWDTGLTVIFLYLLQ